MLDLKGAQEWVVTTKLGSSDVRPGTTPVVTRNCRLYAGEMAMSAFVLSAAIYGVLTVNRWTFSIFLFLQVPLNFASVAFEWWCHVHHSYHKCGDPCAAHALLCVQLQTGGLQANVPQKRAHVFNT